MKNSLQRLAPLSPELSDAYLAMPRLSDRWAVPGPRDDKPLTHSGRNRYWSPVRAMAGDPSFELYTCKHRAITWMITPVESGGLGLDPATVAENVGHQDGGITIAKYYLKLDQRKAVERARKAMARAAGQAPPLRVVGE